MLGAGAVIAAAFGAAALGAAALGATVIYCAATGAAPGTLGPIALCCKATMATVATPAAMPTPVRGRHQLLVRISLTCAATCTGSPSMARFTPAAKPLVT